MNTKKRPAPPLRQEILKTLADGSILSLADIRGRIEQILDLKQADIVRHPKRQNGPKWYSDLSNRLQPSRSGSLVSTRYVEKLDKDQFRITSTGQEELNFLHNTAGSAALLLAEIGDAK